MDEDKTTTGAEQVTDDDKEWGNALDDYLSSKGLENKEGGDDEDESIASGDKSTTGDRSPADKPAADSGAKATDADDEINKDAADDEGDKKPDAEVADQVPEYDATAADYRRTEREIREDRETFVSELREKLYPDLKTELTDSEGKAIRNVKDLLDVENPVTGKAFTEEQASLYLIQAQQHIAKQNDEAKTRLSDIADVQMDIRDGSKAVAKKWGTLLNDMEQVQPGFKNKLLNAYKRTLTVENDVTIKYALRPEEFYDTALAGYEESRKLLQDSQKTAEQLQTEQKITQQKLDKAQRKSDRSDITSGNNTDTRPTEDKEWDEAAKLQFGDRLNTKKK